MIDPKSILLEILRESESKGFFVSTTHLVKLLYLSEVEYFRDTSRRLTNLAWIFYHYGPYAFELQDVLKQREFQQEQLESRQGKKYSKFRVAETASTFQTKLDPKVALVIKRVVGTWGKLSLEELLDYVYFETEPMQAVVKRGQHLDFTTIRKDTSTVVVPLKASKETEEKVAELRERLAPSLERLSTRNSTREPDNEAFREAIETWDQEEAVNSEALQRLKITIKPHSDSGTQRH